MVRIFFEDAPKVLDDMDELSKQIGLSPERWILYFKFLQHWYSGRKRLNFGRMEWLAPL